MKIKQKLDKNLGRGSTLSKASRPAQRGSKISTTIIIYIFGTFAYFQYSRIYQNLSFCMMECTNLGKKISTTV